MEENEFEGIMTHCLYKLTSPSGKVYFGLAENFEKRMKGHAKAARLGKDTAVCHAIRKHGWGEFKKEIVAYGNKNYIANLEIKAISHFGTLVPNGYNMSLGGELSPMKSRCVRDKVSGILIGRKFSEEHKRNISKSRKGRFLGKNNPRFGVPISEEGSRKIAKANSERIISDETRAKMSSSQKGKIISEEQKVAISRAVSGDKNGMAGAFGEKNPMFGKTHSDENKKKMREAQKRIFDAKRTWAKQNGYTGDIRKITKEMIYGK